jgi:hypothetical protein
VSRLSLSHPCTRHEPLRAAPPAGSRAMRGGVRGVRPIPQRRQGSHPHHCCATWFASHQSPPHPGDLPLCSHGFWTRPPPAPLLRLHAAWSIHPILQHTVQMHCYKNQRTVVTICLLRLFRCFSSFFCFLSPSKYFLIKPIHQRSSR